MNKYSYVQRKSLSEFFNTIAAAWFTAGIISPFFTKPKTLPELLLFVILGIFMTWLSLKLSLKLINRQ